MNEEKIGMEIDGRKEGRVTKTQKSSQSIHVLQRKRHISGPKFGHPIEVSEIELTVCYR